jgi:multiple sugar transport system substrate-binding protein
MCRRALALAASLVVAPLGAKAADLVVWWEKGYYAQEDEAVRETIAAFAQDTGKQVELVFQQQEELPPKIMAALEAGQPPDFAFGIWIVENVGQWAFDDRLVDLSDAVGHFSDLFDSDALDREVLLNGETGQKALYAGRSAPTGSACRTSSSSAPLTIRPSPRASMSTSSRSSRTASAAGSPPTV